MTSPSKWASRPGVSPIYQSASYSFAGLDEVEAVQDGLANGFIYARYADPNAEELETAIAKLERVPQAAVFSSGMAAIYCALAAVCRPGDHIVAGDTLYGGTMTLLTDVLPRWGITTTFCDVADAGNLDKAITPATRVVLLETISNPLLRVADLPGIAEACRRAGIVSIVDNTFATPVVVRPCEHGIDLVVHSVTKFLCGHSDVTLGAAAGRPDLVDEIKRLRRVVGSCPDPFASWLAARGLRTLALRLEKQCDNALTVARFLERSPHVAAVHYPGLPNHPDHQRARGLLGDRFGAMVTLELAGGRPGAERFIRSLERIRFVPSLGDVSTTMSHPATTSHRALGEDELAVRGISEGTIRLSVGCESANEVIADLERALAALGV